MEFLKQLQNKARTGFSYLTQNLGSPMSYLKQIPEVGRFMQDSQGLGNLASKLAGAYRKRKRGEEYDLPSADDLVGAVQSGDRTMRNLKSGAYRPK